MVRNVFAAIRSARLTLNEGACRVDSSEIAKPFQAHSRNRWRTKRKFLNGGRK